MPTLAEQVAALEAENGQLRRDLFAYQAMNANQRSARQAKMVEKAMREEREWRQLYDEAKSSQAAAESRLASARVEGAREQQAAWVAGVRWMCEKFAEAPEVVRAGFTPEKGDVVFYCGERIENIAAEKYPAPAAPAGEQTRPAPTEREGARTVCNRPCFDSVKCATHGCWRVSPTPEPLTFDVNVSSDGDWWHTMRVTLPPDVTRRIVALGSRPTQTAEG